MSKQPPQLNRIDLKSYQFSTWGESYEDYKKTPVVLDRSCISSKWRDLLKDIFDSEDYKKLEKFFQFALTKTDGAIKIFPYPDLVFNAFSYLEPEDVKVVILGQDPYYRLNHEKPQAMGLSFSVPIGSDTPPSLVNVYKNLIKFNHIDRQPAHGNLEFWAYQGVLLLNTALTVQEGHPNSHSKKWQFFTDRVVSELSKKQKNIVFLLWGRNALAKQDLIDEKKHKIVASSHPSPLSVSKRMGAYGAFENTDHFGEANSYLRSKERSPIIWTV